MPVTFCIRFAHPTGRPSGAAQTTLCCSKKKSPKNAATLTAKLDHDGCISQCCFSSSSRGFIAKRYRGYFFVLHLYQALRSSLPVSEIVVLLFITLCLTVTLSPPNPHHAQWFFRVKDYSFELRVFILFLLSFLSGMRSSIVKAGR